tara:strand:- start:83 stop:220 length:138 start_codon:yes stop_codon:yes gene_type:complete
MARDIKKEMFELKGGDFPKWYSSLTKLEKAEYRLILEKLSQDFRK